MLGENQYFSFVSDRILALKKELEQTEEKLQNAQKEENKKKAATSKMEIKFLQYKIEYLEKIKDLPFYIVINELSSEQLREIRSSIGKLGLTLEETRAYLMDKLGLHGIPSLIKPSDISCLEQIKDYETIINLAIIQQRNGNYKQQKRDLQRELVIPIELCSPVAYQVFGVSGKTKPLCYHEIDYIKKKLENYSTKLGKIMETLRSNYSIEKIAEIISYLNSPEKGLSRKFIETHMKMVISRFPEEKATVKYLLQSENRKSILESVSQKKKRKKEQEFLECVVGCYRNDDILPFFEMGSTDIFKLSKEELRAVFREINEAILTKQGKIKELSQSVRQRQNQILNTARDYNILQTGAKEEFSKIIYSKIPDFQNAWLHWIWQVPDIIEVFMKGHTLAEVEDLKACLENPFPYYEEDALVKQIVYTLKSKK